MSDRGIASLLGYLRRRVATEPELTPDGELLRRYAQSRDEDAFELLVRRHGAMVHGVGRRVLRDDHAAEDVLQATFVTLVRKAHGLRRRDCVAGWLYRVALRIALAARPKTLSAAIPTQSEPTNDVEVQELRSVLDAEIDRLPERLRQTVLLCYLNGYTAEDAARKLGCPRGTVFSRLAAARARLQKQLTRRGYALPAAGLATLLSVETAPATLPVALVALAVRAAGPGAALSPSVLSLAHGVTHAMMMTKLKIGTAVIVAMGILGISSGHLFGPTPAIATNFDTNVGEGPSFQRLKIDVDDLEAVTGLNIYKFQLDLPMGQRFRMSLREVRKADTEPVELTNFVFKKTIAGPITVRVSFIGLNRKLTGFLLSEEKQAEWRADCTGCTPSEVATVAPLPLADLPNTQKSLIVSKSKEQAIRAGNIGIDLLTIVAKKREPREPVPMEYWTVYPRAELVIVPEP